MALQDALNLSYQIITQDQTQQEQSIIEDKITKSRARGMKYLTPLITNKEGNNTDSTAEGDSKGIVSRYKLNAPGADKVSQSTILSAKKLGKILRTPIKETKGNNQEDNNATPDSIGMTLTISPPNMKRAFGHEKQTVVSFGGSGNHSPDCKSTFTYQNLNKISYSQPQK